MRRLGLRALMAAVGVVLLVAYGAAAYVAYWALAAVWAARPDPTTTAFLLVAAVLVLSYLSYRFGTRRLLASLRARPIPRERAPALYDRVAELCEAMDVDAPTLYLARMAVPNAFAIGGVGDGAVVLDRSLFDFLATEEMDGILAHELAHLESHDGLVQTLAFSVGQTLSGVLAVVLFPVSLLATGLAKAWAWLAGTPGAWTENPFGRVRVGVDAASSLVLVALTLAVRAHSRNREFAADDRAADVTGRPVALARALRKIERASDPEWGVLSPLYVHSDDEDNPLSEWFSTHPSVDERVERLRERADARSVEIPVE